LDYSYCYYCCRYKVDLRSYTLVISLKFRLLDGLAFCAQRGSGSINSYESQKNLDQIFTKTGSYRVRSLFSTIYLHIMSVVRYNATVKRYFT